MQSQASGWQREAMLGFLHCSQTFMERPGSFPLFEESRGSPHVALQEGTPLALNRRSERPHGWPTHSAFCGLERKDSSQEQESSKAFCHGKGPASLPHHEDERDNKKPETGSITIPASKAQTTKEASDNCFVVN